MVQTCRRLARGSSADGAVLLDGAHLIEDAAASGVRMDAVLAGTRFHREAGRLGAALLQRLARAGATVYDASEPVLAAASPVRTPSGIVAIGRWSTAPLDEVLSAAPALVVGLVGVQDPGNLGAAIRSADAMGATGVVAIDAAADPGGWKALRGAMGSTFRLPVGRASLAEVLAKAKQRGLTISGATAAGGAAPADVTLTDPMLILFGSEGAGLPDAALPHDALRITIPMRRGVESLNVAVSAALVLYEARRQRVPSGAMS